MSPDAIAIDQKSIKQDPMKIMLEEFRRFFNLHDMPFSLLPNTHYYVDLPSHQQCFSMLMFAVASGEGIIKIIGEVGTGKTLLCRRLLNGLDEDEYYSAYIPNPNLNPVELKRALAKELQVPDLSWLADDELMEAINKRLIKFALNNKRVVLVIDEAQSLPDESIEAIRLLTNLETESEKLMQVVLFAQPELDETLSKYHLRQLKQRISFSQRLGQLDKPHIRQYIQHRLAIAGYNGKPIFNEDAIKFLHQCSQGVPRLISIICSKSLLIAFSKGEHTVTKAMVKKAVMDTESIDYRPKWFFGLI
ncbi:MAG: MSHA biogenesis protein MshM [Bermanella sp.]|jgi:MSHA biogenesis protein MshM